MAIMNDFVTYFQTFQVPIYVHLTHVNLLTNNYINLKNGKINIYY